MRVQTCIYFNCRTSRPDASAVETAQAIKLHDDLLAQQPEGARHDSDICPICVDKASAPVDEPTASRIPPADPVGGPDVSESDQSPTNTEGGTPNPMSETISKETHEALLQKAVADATSVTEKALETKAAENTELAGKVEALETEVADHKADNDRLNKELDTAQVSLKAATDEVASLKADVAAKEEAAAKAEVASERAKQVKNLGLFTEDYVSEKASAWADLTDEAWAERVDEWQKLQPAATSDEAAAKTTDTASAMTGTSEELTKELSDEASETPKPRRAALGLS